MVGSQPNQSLIEGIRCLQELVIAGKPLGCREIARRLGIHPVRANRLLLTLKSIGLVQQNYRRKYSPGSGIHILAAQTLHGSQEFRLCLPLLEKMGQQRPWSVAMGVLWRDWVCYFYHGRPFYEGGIPLAQAPPFPATLSTIGLMLLALSDEQTIYELYKHRQIPGYPEGIARLLQDLTIYRDQGYVTRPPSQDRPYKNFAVPIGNPPFAAISYFNIPVTVPDQEVLDLLRSIVNEYNQQEQHLKRNSLQ